MNLQELENKREWVVTIAWYSKLIRISLVIFWIYIWVTLKADLFVVIMLFGLGYWIPYAFFDANYGYFRDQFRSTILKDLVSRYGNPGYSSEGFIGESIFRSSGLFQPDFTFYTGEDLLIFSNFGNLQLCELNIDTMNVINKGKGKEVEVKVKFFQGLFGVATFPFTFEGETIVKARGSKFTVQSIGEEVKLESPRFMEIWSISSTSQVGARLALGTDIMNNLLYLKEKVDKNISMSFVSNQVFFAREQDKFLEPDYCKSVLVQDSVKALQVELEIIQSIIGTFKLHQNI
jgi:Protein of unknown function (DUF3137)